MEGYSCLCGRIQLFVWIDSVVCVEGYSCLCGRIQLFVWMDTVAYMEGPCYCVGGYVICVEG